MITTYPVIIFLAFLSEAFSCVKDWLLKFSAEGLRKQSAKVIEISDVAGRANINEKAEQALNNHGNSVLRIAYSYLHNMCDAEDVLQDTLIQFIKTAPHFYNTSHEKAWLMRVAINISKNKILYNKRRKTFELDDNLIENEREDLRFVWESVKNLSEKYREVMHLFYHEGYSTAQIAVALQKNEATIRSLLHRGRGKLKEILKEAYDFEE